MWKQLILKHCPVLTKILQVYASQNKDATFLSDVSGDSFTKNEIDEMENAIVKTVYDWCGQTINRDDLEVIGCGSIGRVYRYDTVVFKVKIPGIVEKIHTNYSWLRPIFQVVDFLTNSEYHLIKRGTTFMENICKQYDFISEASNLENYQENLLKYNFKFEEICTPVVIPELCNNDIICMEYIEGTEMYKINDLPLNVVDTFLRFSFANNLLFERMHLDLHGGNILLRDNQQIVVIDFGMTQKCLEKKYIMVFLNIVDAMIHQDVDRLATNFARTFFIDPENTKDVLTHSKEYYDDLYFNIIHAYHIHGNETMTASEFAQMQYTAIDKWTLTHDVYSTSSLSGLETVTIHMLQFLEKQKDEHKQILEPRLKKYIRDLLDVCL
jgi:predicted unusual protein kinase regulating ubiquinone biosynthesis (AarF/ABC1/UbiB family)